MPWNNFISISFLNDTYIQKFTNVFNFSIHLIDDVFLRYHFEWLTCKIAWYAHIGIIGSNGNHTWIIIEILFGICAASAGRHTVLFILLIWSLIRNTIDDLSALQHNFNIRFELNSLVMQWGLTKCSSDSIQKWAESYRIQKRNTYLFSVKNLSTKNKTTWSILNVNIRWTPLLLTNLLRTFFLDV